MLDERNVLHILVCSFRIWHEGTDFLPFYVVVRCISVLLKGLAEKRHKIQPMRAHTQQPTSLPSTGRYLLKGPDRFPHDSTLSCY